MRVACIWKALPERVVEAGPMTAFKNSLKGHLNRLGIGQWTLSSVDTFERLGRLNFEYTRGQERTVVRCRRVEGDGNE